MAGVGLVTVSERKSIISMVFSCVSRHHITPFAAAQKEI
jgi:hypothetical protein